MKQYQDSLSPNGKAQVLVQHATQQQKYRQSLLPEDKAQMLTKKADTERKQRKSLPPEKKVNILETDVLHTRSSARLSLVMTKFKF